MRRTVPALMVALVLLAGCGSSTSRANDGPGDEACSEYLTIVQGFADGVTAFDRPGIQRDLEERVVPLADDAEPSLSRGAREAVVAVNQADDDEMASEMEQFGDLCVDLGYLTRTD